MEQLLCYRLKLGWLWYCVVFRPKVDITASSGIVHNVETRRRGSRQLGKSVVVDVWLLAKVPDLSEVSSGSGPRCLSLPKSGHGTNNHEESHFGGALRHPALDISSQFRPSTTRCFNGSTNVKPEAYHVPTCMLTRLRRELPKKVLSLFTQRRPTTAGQTTQVP